MRFSITAGGLLFASLVSAHCKITNAVGDDGGKAVAFGIQKGSGNSQDDVTIFKQGTFGATAKGQAIDPAKDLAAVQAQAGNTLPQVTDGGQLTLTLHQNNGDGAGPMACQIDTAADGKFTAITIITDVPGNNGNSGANNQDFPLVVQLDAGTVCTGALGGVTAVCLVKCANPTGPFGGVVPIQISGKGGKANGGKANGGKANGNAGKKNNRRGTFVEKAF